jgi:hypothetical protein
VKSGEPRDEHPKGNEARDQINPAEGCDEPGRARLRLGLWMPRNQNIKILA